MSECLGSESEPAPSTPSVIRLMQHLPSFPFSRAWDSDPCSSASDLEMALTWSSGPHSREGGHSHSVNQEGCRTGTAGSETNAHTCLCKVRLCWPLPDRVPFQGRMVGGSGQAPLLEPPPDLRVSARGTEPNDPRWELCHSVEVKRGRKHQAVTSWFQLCPHHHSNCVVPCTAG